jgi:hypothetical protein
MDKIALAKRLLQKLAEKRAGIMLPVAAGAALAGGAHILGKGLKKSHEYKAGFQPGGYGPGGH